MNGQLLMETSLSNKWNERYMAMAKEVAQWSKDPNTKVGAIAVGSKGQILSQGYNGFPRGINDSEDRLNDRETKYKYVVHAEMNVIYNATYSGVSLDGSKLYVYGLPVCSECAKGIIQVGITEVYVAQECIDLRPQWFVSFQQTMDMFNEAGIKVFAV
jgi:dCMP deaminase